MPPRGPSALRWPFAVAVGVVIGVAVGGFGLVTPGLHTYCSMGSAVATTPLATPIAMVNSPYAGAASLNLSGDGPQYSFGSGSLNVTSDPWVPLSGENYGASQNGSEPWGLYMTVNWTVYSTQNTTGISGSGPCTQAYVAEVGLISSPQGSYSMHLFRLSLPNLTTDYQEPTSIPGVPSVQFANGLDPRLGTVTAQSGSETYYPYSVGFGTCSVSPRSFQIIPTGTLRVPISVPFTVHGQGAEASGFLSWSGLEGYPTAVYTMPDLAGSWQFVSVGAPFSPTPSLQSPAPSGLYSFSYYACPA
ncbi:MAG TPA: hypothetical protein VEH28_07220 [Thermoplasmata archaeon]|nr:hypothetical protein [Thermoplasmata archaeon]